MSINLMEKSYYQEILSKELKRNLIPRTYCFTGKDAGKHHAYQFSKAGDLIFNVIDLMLDENDPLFTREIVDVLSKPLRIRYIDEDRSLTGYISNAAKSDLGKKHLIHILSVPDAVRMVYNIAGKNVKVDNSSWRTTPKSSILFKSRDKLISRIKSSTLDLEETVLVKCKF